MNENTNYRMTKEEFISLPEMSGVVSGIRASAIICYVCAAITLLAHFLVPNMGAGLIDAFILLALGLIIHFTKHFVGGIALLAYAVFNMVVMFIVTKTISGWLILIAGIFAVSRTFKLRQAWQEYMATGEIPDVSARK